MQTLFLLKWIRRNIIFFVSLRKIVLEHTQRGHVIHELQHFKCCILQSWLSSTAKIKIAENYTKVTVEYTHKSITNMSSIKGYLHYKTILCHKVALDVQLMIFFIWRKNNVSFWRYQDFCVFVKSADSKTCDVIISIAG